MPGHEYVTFNFLQIATSAAFAGTRATTCVLRLMFPGNRLLTRGVRRTRPTCATVGLTCLLFTAFDGLVSGEEFIWTGNNDGTFHVITTPSGDQVIQYPLTRRWDVLEVRDAHGNILAPGNWSQPSFPDGSDADVWIVNPGPGKSAPPIIEDISVTVRNLTLASGGGLDLQAGFGTYGRIIVTGGIVNGGGVNLVDPDGWPGSFTEFLVSGGDLALSGGGAIQLVPLAGMNNVLGGVSPTDRLINVDNTITGAGFIGRGSMGFVNQGLVDASRSSGHREIIVQPSAAGAINMGTMRSRNGGTLTLQEGLFDNSGGLIQAQSGSVVKFDRAQVRGGTIEAETLDFYDDAGVFDVTLVGSNGFVGWNNELTLGGVIDNQGAVTAYRHFYIAGGDTTLTGGGTFTLAGIAMNASAADSRLINANNIIQGTGSIGSGAAGVINHGLIDADRPGSLGVGGAMGVNTGTIRASGGNLGLGSIDNTGGLIQAMTDRTVVIGGSVDGGRLEIGVGATVHGSGSLGSNIHVENQGVLAVTDLNSITVNNGGTVQPYSIGPNWVRISGDVLIAGSGLITGTYFGTSSHSRLTNDGGTLSNVTISNLNVTHNGLLDGGTLSTTAGSSPLEFANNGTMQSRTSRNLTVTNMVLSNEDGLIRSDGGILQITNSSVVGGELLAANGATARLNEVTFDGTTVRTEVGSTLLLQNHVSGSMRLSNSAGGHVDVSSGATLELSPNGTYDNQGTIAVNYAGQIAIGDGDVTLLPGGMVMLEPGGSSIVGAGAAPRLINHSTIRGTGMIGWYRVVNENEVGETFVDEISTNLTLVNEGLIEGTLGGEIEFRSNGGSILNTGIIRSNAGGTVVLPGPLLDNAGGLIDFLGGIIQLVGEFNNTGSVAGAFLFSDSAYIQSAGSTEIRGLWEVPLFVLDGGTVSGTGTIRGDFSQTGGILSPGSSPGVLQIDGDALIDVPSTLDMEIGGLLAGLEYDQLDVLGDFAVAGSVNLSLINGFKPQVGNQFNLFLVDGQFDADQATINWLNGPSGLEYSTSFDNGIYAMTITAVPEPSSWALAITGVLGVMVVSRRVRGTRRVPRR